MKYNLQGFSQEVASELNIDGIDLYLLRWFVDFKDTNQMDTKIVDGEVYYWIYHKKVSEDMPILHLQKTIQKNSSSRERNFYLLCHRA